ncbi:unnamed protein product [Gadus morhua 'NCC']
MGGHDTHLCVLFLRTVFIHHEGPQKPNTANGARSGPSPAIDTDDFIEPPPGPSFADRQRSKVTLGDDDRKYISVSTTVPTLT